MSSLNSLLNPESTVEREQRSVPLSEPLTTIQIPSKPTSPQKTPTPPPKSPEPTYYQNDMITRPHPPHHNCPDTLDCLPDTNGRPQHTLPVILRCAILGSPNKRLTIREIYSAMERKYPYYKTAGPAWKQSVRHHLSLNRLFERQPRPVSEPGFGSHWTVNLEAPPGTKRPRKRGQAGRPREIMSDPMPRSERRRDRYRPRGPPDYPHYPPHPHMGYFHPATTLRPVDAYSFHGANRNPGPYEDEYEDDDDEEGSQWDDDQEMSEDDYEGERHRRYDSYPSPPASTAGAHAYRPSGSSSEPPHRSITGAFSGYGGGGDPVLERTKQELEGYKRHASDMALRLQALHEELSQAKQEASSVRSALRKTEHQLEEERRNSAAMRDMLEGRVRRQEVMMHQERSYPAPPPPPPPPKAYLHPKSR